MNASVVLRPLVRTSLRLPCLIPNSVSFCATSSHEVGSNKFFEEALSKNKVVVFMKGVPDAPKCGFSNAVVQILRMHGVNYDSYDVLADERIRQGVKEYSSWPTIPQVFIGGEFVGGCDIILQMHQNGDLIEELKKAGITSTLLEKDPKSH
ncbi:unnamed protein product [Darwinula stevensoni]|uniref:Glutaredoxin-related protein 5, mitochondrial n=1 Tax=Darwinula stevensoni TaxID=69355 RepID=A0A7R9AEL9_9CRUS|nr:unnamed protein product [Darwinula stevensoni]CAG0902125.1 unnamed protein product [Darwinula stevensoni]